MSRSIDLGADFKRRIAASGLSRSDKRMWRKVAGMDGIFRPLPKAGQPYDEPVWREVLEDVATYWGRRLMDWWIWVSAYDFPALNANRWNDAAELQDQVDRQGLFLRGSGPGGGSAPELRNVGADDR